MKNPTHINTTLFFWRIWNVCVWTCLIKERCSFFICSSSLPLLSSLFSRSAVRSKSDNSLEERDKSVQAGKIQPAHSLFIFPSFFSLHLFTPSIQRFLLPLTLLFRHSVLLYSCSVSPKSHIHPNVSALIQDQLQSSCSPGDGRKLAR